MVGVKTQMTVFLVVVFGIAALCAFVFSPEPTEERGKVAKSFDRFGAAATVVSGAVRRGVQEVFRHSDQKACRQPGREQARGARLRSVAEFQ